jgi:hypothetical protein
VWSTLLEENGISVIPLDDVHVSLRRGGRAATYAVVSSVRRVHPSDVGAPPEPNSLLVAPALSDAAAALARSRGWSVVPEKGPAWLRFYGKELELSRPTSSSETAATRKRGRPGWGIFSVVRALLAVEEGARQDELAEFSRVSQPRVSQALRELVALGLAERELRGWIVTDKAAVIEWWSAHYPGPGGLASHWYGLDPVVQQAYRVHELLAADRSRPAVSGDVAADLVAPWRTPRHALLYAERGADLSAAGLTPAGPAEATLTLILPADRAVWPVGRAPWTVGLTGYGNVARAGALQVLYDLTRAGGPDAGEARQAWLDWMLSSGAVV